MAFTDAYGIWEVLGSLTVSEDWQLFNLDAGRAKTFRLIFTSNWQNWEDRQGWPSRGIIRPYYINDAGTAFDLVGPSFRVYPKPEPMYLTIEIPPEFVDNPFIRRKIGFKRIPPARYWRISPDLASNPWIEWGLEIHAFDSI